MLTKMTKGGAVTLLLLSSASALLVRAFPSHSALSNRPGSLSQNRDPNPTWTHHASYSTHTLMVRGGASFDKVSLLSSPENVFGSLLAGLAISSIAWKSLSLLSNKDVASEKPRAASLLQTKFLAVFWSMRMADWLQGPYFYEVYSTKIIAGTKLTSDMVSKLFLIGFATTAVFGPAIGRLVDHFGRRSGTIAFAFLYALSALSTQASSLPVLILGRIAGGLGTALLFCAPEAWLVSEHEKEGLDGRWLGQTFGRAYSGDAIVAIAAGQIAAVAARRGGPSAPFISSIIFLVLGSLFSGLTWKENASTKMASSRPRLRDAMKSIFRDKRVLMIGVLQALFEAAMYIFVLQWPPLMELCVRKVWGVQDVPYGTVFSCLMASCLLGASAFHTAQIYGISVENISKAMLGLAAAAMTTLAGLSTHSQSLNPSTTLASVLASFVVFEACVGCYFPTIGMLRSAYIPSENRSAVMTLFGVPLNLLVVAVFMSMKTLGVHGALCIASVALVVAALTALQLPHQNSIAKQ